jgi:hypothetical protein
MAIDPKPAKAPKSEEKRRDRGRQATEKSRALSGDEAPCQLVHTDERQWKAEQCCDVVGEGRATEPVEGEHGNVHARPLSVACDMPALGVEGERVHPQPV